MTYCDTTVSCTGVTFLLSPLCFAIILGMDELSDMVDRKDQKVTVKNRNDIEGDFVNTRYINIFICNHKGQFWVPWRRDDLKRWPASPDFAVGGAVEAGENYLSAAIREAKEEVGLELVPDSLKEIAYLSPYKFPVACFSKVYEHICDEVSFTSAEYKSAQWMELLNYLRC